MANARRPIPPLRAYTATVLGVFALFVISAGAGMASWSIVVLGLALMIFAISLVAVSAMRGGARAYAAGTAHVVSASQPPPSATYGRCELNLIVDAPGVASAAVTIRDPRVPVAKWPDAGATLPIMVAVDDPRRVRIQWDDVPTHAEAAADDGGAADAYSGEYADYVPSRGPLDVPPEPTPTAGTERTAGTSGTERTGGTGPATADLTDELTGLYDGDDEPSSGTAMSAPPPPRRPEASPESPEEEVYPVDGETVFSPKVPEPADSAAPAAGVPGAPASGPGAPASSPGAPASGADGAEPAPPAEPASPAAHSRAPREAGQPPRPRPRPAAEEQANAATRRGAVTGAAQAAATGTAVADAQTETDPTDLPAPAGAEPSGPGEASAEPRSTPSVTAIEFDLGQLITAYPSARPGRAGEIHGVGVTLLVRDLTRSTEFYRDVLGFYEIDGGDGNVVLASGDTRVVLRADPAAPEVDHRVVHINLEVTDVRAVYQELKAKGVRFTSGPRPTAVGDRLEPWAATLRDPDGHGIAITQWRTRGASGG